MNDVFLFIHHGWKSIWKQKPIWLFSAATILSPLYNLFQVERSTDLLSSLITLTTSLFFLYLFLVNYIGVPYLAYNYLLGKPVSVQETLSAVKKFSGRVIGCSCLVILASLPLFFWVLAISINSSTHKVEVPDKAILEFLQLLV